MAFERIWHQQYAQGVPGEIEIERITMPEVLTRTAQRFPDAIAFVYMGKTITYRKLENLVNRFARALLDLGVAKGDKVGMILPNMPQVVIADMAAQRIGAITSMINWYRATFGSSKSTRTSNTIQPPTLIIWGKKDPHLSHQMAPLSLEYCQDGKLVYFDDATHWVQHDKPSEVSQLMIDHFSEK